MTEIEEAMRQFIDGLTEELKANVPSVTGKTASQIEGTVEAKGSGEFVNVKGEIVAPITLVVRETGRGPTKTKVAGDPTLQEIILEWLKASGKRPNDPKMTLEQLSWAIATKMHQEGDKLYRSAPTGYKKTGVISDVINDERLDSFFNVFLDKSSEIVKKSFLDKVKK